MERYREIIPEWGTFQEECKSDTRTAIRKNRIKSAVNFEPRLEDRFELVERSSWNPDIYRLRGEELPGKTTMHWRGEYYVQEESAALPVEMLNPRRNEKILDMCAAPGGKATQIASLIDNQGTVVANDSSSKRMKSLHANVYRTGSACIVATNRDGRQLPGREKYDRILVDAPCSGEGDRARRDLEPADREDIEGLAELQKQLVKKASELLKPGGVIVYSTCTIAPEENEEVVEHALEETDLELDELRPSVDHQKGVTEFEDKEYRHEVQKTVRVYPHHLESGVIYVARFRG